MSTRSHIPASQRFTSWFALPIALVLTMTLTACGGGQDQQAEQTETETADTLGTIAEVASNDSRLSTLVTALDSAGLKQRMHEEKSFTVFAPTNAAFDKLPEGTMQDLLQPENRNRLTEILTYHIVEGANMAADVQGLSSVATLEGSPLSISTGNGSVQVGNATVVQADVEARNGVIHAIDTVLMPPSDNESM